MVNEKQTCAAAQTRRARRQWVLLLVMLAVVALGWRYPYLGFVVPVVMVTGMLGGLFAGRWVCGNLCPRGSFFDRILARLSVRRSVPSFLKSMPLRWVVFAAMMTVMISQALRDVGNPRHWGHVFWLMCTATTLLAVVLGLWFRERAWCTFCPVGTVARALGGARHTLRRTESCRACGLCDKACPMEIGPGHADCLHCGLCAAVCPCAAVVPR